MQIECINVCPISMPPSSSSCSGGGDGTGKLLQMLPLKFLPLNVFKGKQGHKIAFRQQKAEAASA
jgi:hypothetical protein